MGSYKGYIRAILGKSFRGTTQERLKNKIGLPAFLPSHIMQKHVEP